MRVLLLDDEPSAAALREAMRARPDAELRRAPAATSAVAALVDVERPQVAILGPAAAGRPDVAGVIAALAERIPVVVVGEHDRAAAAVSALKAGAADYVPLGAPDLAERVATAAEGPACAPSAAGQAEVAGLVGVSPAIERVRAMVLTAARTGAPVLVQGQPGTGNGLVAQ